VSQQQGWFPSKLRELDTAECLELLASRSVGRVAYCDEAGPVVLPVNHIVDNGNVLIRVSPHSLLANHLRSGPAAFEVDEFDDFNQTGWSVLVRGMASFLDYDELPDSDTRPTPWAEGQRTFHVRITPTDISGRRLLPV